MDILNSRVKTLNPSYEEFLQSIDIVLTDIVSRFQQDEFFLIIGLLSRDMRVLIVKEGSARITDYSPSLEDIRLIDELREVFMTYYQDSPTVIRVAFNKRKEKMDSLYLYSHDEVLGFHEDCEMFRDDINKGKPFRKMTGKKDVRFEGVR